MSKNPFDDSSDGREDEIRDLVDKARDPNLPGVRGSDVTPKKLFWRWPGHVPLGTVAECCGDPGLFKSGIAVDFSARITTGAPFPGQPADASRPPGKVLFFSAEDDLETTLVPRFIVAGGNLDLIQFVTAVHKLPSLPDDEKLLRSWIKSWKPALLVLDPWDAFLGPKLDPNSNPHARKALLPLIKLGSETGMISWLIRHLNKDAKLGRAMYRSAGSIGTTAATRASFLIGEKPGQPNTFIFACTKLNGAPKPPSLGYRVVEHILDDGIKTQRVEWLAETAETADDLVREPEPARRGPRPEKLAAAQVFLREVLKDGLEHPSDQILAQGKEQGISKTTLNDAADKLGVKRRRWALLGVGCGPCPLGAPSNLRFLGQTPTERRTYTKNQNPEKTPILGETPILGKTPIHRLNLPKNRSFLTIAPILGQAPSRRVTLLILVTPKNPKNRRFQGVRAREDPTIADADDEVKF